MKRFIPLLLTAILAVVTTAGCRGQATVTPAPTAAVSAAALTCPSGYTCGYIASRATCTSATACPTPSSGGPYTPQETAANALSTPTYEDQSPPEGVYIAYTFQFVLLTGPGITTPITGAPSVASAATLIAVYPGTPAQPSVVETAELAPPIKTNNAQPVVAANNLPTTAKPTVKISWRY